MRGSALNDGVFASMLAESPPELALALMVKGGLILAVVFVSVLVIRRQASSIRHFVWTLSFVGLALLPLLSALLPPIPVNLLPALTDAAAPLPGTAAGEGPQSPFSMSRATEGLSLGAPSVVGSLDRVGELVPADAEQFTAWTFGDMVFAVYLLGVGGLLSRLILGVTLVSLLRRKARPVTDASLLSMHEDLRTRLGIARKIPLLTSSAISAPMTCGFLRPVIVLPGDSKSLPESCQRDFLHHELSHVARWDWATHLLVQTVCALYWVNPLVWVAKRKLTLEAELACDDRVIRAGRRASEYAQHLLMVAERDHAAGRGLMAGVAMVRRHQLSNRIEAILDGQRRRHGIYRPLVGAGLFFGMMSLMPLAALQEVRAAQEREPPIGIGALIEQLELEDHRDAAIVELAKLGRSVTAALMAALEVELEQGHLDTAGAVVRALGALGTEGIEAKAKLEELAGGDRKPLAQMALNALVSMRAAGITLITDYSDNRILEIDKNGKVIHEITEVFGPWDAEILPNGNYLITEFSVSRVTERTKDGRVVWSMGGRNTGELKNPYDADRLANGNTLIADTFGGRVIEVDEQRNTVWTYDKEIRPFDVERLANGNTLIADVLKDRVLEVDPKGEIVWEVANMSNVHDVDRLPNGNTLITLRTANRVLELDPDGNEVFRIENLNSPSDADRLANGNTLVAENRMVREFDRLGNVVWEKEMTWAVEVNRY